MYGADKWVDPLPGGEEGQLHQAAAGEDHGEDILHVLRGLPGSGADTEVDNNKGYNVFMLLFGQDLISSNSSLQS